MELMAEISLTGNVLHKAENEYHGKFGHTIGRIQHIAIMIIIDTCYTTCHLENQTVAPTIHGLRGINICVQYVAIHPHKRIFYPSNYYYGSNAIILTWSGNQIEYYTTHIFLE